MDVVEAKPSDWQRDPFTPVIENGLLYGRGASDTKLNDALVVAALIELKRRGYKPKRDLIMEFSGDEETTMKTSELIAKQLPRPEMVLNTDGSGGLLDESGKPIYFVWKGAEKTANDFELTFLSPGGHSSAPREGENAIARLAAVLVKIDHYHFKPELNDITRHFFADAASFEDPQTGEAMRAFAADPANEQALAVLRRRPALVGATATTCVPTMISGGHAVNALPQRAVANINCRVFPGHPPAQILEELQQVGGDASVEFKDVTVGSVPTDASPIRPDLVAAVTKAIHIGYPGVPVFPAMSSGASDSEWFRRDGVPAYNISPLFIKRSDQFSHGLNERVPVANIGPSIRYLLSLFTDLTSSKQGS
jgi:acetylornithine deacetylase/succinyl-diaminopimelate desuccinylase-like protein